MRPHPRIRKTIKWGGLVVAVAIASLWGFSLRVHLRGEALCGYMTSFAHGHCRVSHLVPSPVHQTHFTYNVMNVPLRPAWGFEYYAQDSYWSARFPLWLPFLLVAIPTALAWRLDTLATRRARVGMCPKCSYPRTGLAPSSPCPECGAAAPQA